MVGLTFAMVEDWCQRREVDCKWAVVGCNAVVVDTSMSGGRVALWPEVRASSPRRRLGSTSTRATGRCVSGLLIGHRDHAQGGTA